MPANVLPQNPSKMRNPSLESEALDVEYWYSPQFYEDALD
uniref:Uncharacterized protein n=1 Tax=Romanomermis culicivorax TaxID=13658 RepID=A0A915KAQ0_ROMCU